LEIGLELLM